MADRGRARRLLVGVFGPEVRTSPSVAHLVGPMARTWLDAARGRASREAIVELESWVAALEVAAAHFRRGVSDECADDGHFERGGLGSGDPDVMAGITTKTAGDRLGLDPRSVTRLIGTELRGRRVGREWLIDPDSVEAFKDRRGAA